MKRSLRNLLTAGDPIQRCDLTEWWETDSASLSITKLSWSVLWCHHEVTWFQHLTITTSTLLNHSVQRQQRWHCILVRNSVKRSPKEKPFWYELGTAMQISVIWKNKWLKFSAILKNPESEKGNRPSSNLKYQNSEICENIAAYLKTFRKDITLILTMIYCSQTATNLTTQQDWVTLTQLIRERFILTSSSLFSIEVFVF